MIIWYSSQHVVAKQTIQARQLFDYFLSSEGRKVCVICLEGDDRPTSKLGSKGCKGLIAASEKKGYHLLLLLLIII